jgi:hypothetical protein
MLMCEVLFVPIPSEAVCGGFVDGYTACLLIFWKTIRVPGSESEELIRLAARRCWPQYPAAGPEWEDLLLKVRQNSLVLDRRHARMVRIIGSVELAVIVATICFLAAHGLL